MNEKSESRPYGPKPDRLGSSGSSNSSVELLAGEKDTHLHLDIENALDRRPRRGKRVLIALVTLLTLFGAAWAFSNVYMSSTFQLRPRPSNGNAPFSKAPEPFGHNKLGYEELQKHILETPSTDELKRWVHTYSSKTHLAGQDYDQALRTRDFWREQGIKADIETFNVLLNYPKEHRLAVVSKKKHDDSDSDSSSDSDSDNDKSNNAAEEHRIDLRDHKDWKVEFEAKLEENVLEEDPTSGIPNRIPTFHGYSFSGSVQAPFVFVNYGSYEDFDDLIKANVPIAGKIAIARYGKIFRGLKVKRAQDLGMVGIVIYSDPADDGECSKKNGAEPYPHGCAREPSSVQRGSVQFLSIRPGDPTTPGYPSKKGVPRKDPKHFIPRIPSIPISYEDAIPILKQLNGHGPSAKDFPGDWGNGALDDDGVEYSIGPTPNHLQLYLDNKQEYEFRDIYNVIGTIKGHIPSQSVILGNHRDAWAVGGVGDPSAGSAALNEVARTFGTALQKGWKPMRSIIFTSWDAEEYGLVGSTEWGEKHQCGLRRGAIAYMNLDLAVNGPKFGASGSPLLHGTIRRATDLVPAPFTTEEDKKVGQIWDKKVGPVGSGSDYTVFQHNIGIPTFDIRFKPDEKSPVYHYHSNFDSIYAFETFIDPEYKGTRAIAQILALAAAEIIEQPVLSFSASDYAETLFEYLEELKDYAASNPEKRVRVVEYDIVQEAGLGHPMGVSDEDAEDGEFPSDPNADKHKYNFVDLEASLYEFRAAAKKLDEKAESLQDQIDDITGKRPLERSPWKMIQLLYQIKKINAKYHAIERGFIFKRGLDSRSFYKHVVFAPALWRGYGADTFPGITEAIGEGDPKVVEAWEKVVAGLIKKNTIAISV